MREDSQLFDDTVVSNVLKNIIREIVRECSVKHISVEETFVTYYAKLLTLDPKWNISPEKKLDRNSVQKFVKFCVQELVDQKTCQMTTLKIQLYFNTNIKEKAIMIQQNRNELRARIEPLEVEILESNETSTEELEKLYRKIVVFVTLLFGMGNPTRSTVLKEATYALHSVFVENDLIDLLTKSRKEKESQLLELSEVVAGIRLFNRDCGKGGEEIEDLPKMLTQAVEIMDNELQKKLMELMEIIHKLTTVVENAYVVDENSVREKALKLSLPSFISEVEFQYFKDLLIVSRQYEVYLRQIISETETIAKEAEQLFEDLQNALIEIHNTVKFKTAVPTYQVFPLFKNTSQIWCKIRDVTIVIANFNQILHGLTSDVKSLKLKEPVLATLLGESDILTDADRLEKATGSSISVTDNKCRVIHAASMKDLNLMPPEYLGFCAWSLVQTNGGLIPGNPNLGVCRWKNRSYVFKNAEAAKAFGQDPDRYINSILQISRKNVELICLLQLQKDLDDVSDVVQLVKQAEEVIITNEQEIQTELHPIMEKIDPEYKWNVWDWKRQAIQLANIAKCQTHSTQTYQSHVRSELRTQTYALKDQQAQTKRENYTNVPTLRNFIFGLRGRKDDNQHIIELTRPVKE